MEFAPDDPQDETYQLGNGLPSLEIRERSPGYEPIPNGLEIMEAIQQRLKRQGMTAQELTAHLNIDPSMFSKWKSGAVPLSKENANKILNTALKNKLFANEPWVALRLGRHLGEQDLQNLRKSLPGETKRHNKVHQRIRLPANYIEPGFIDAIIDQLLSTQNSDQLKGKKVLLLWGLNGCGKTTTLIKISQEVAPWRKDGVFWLTGQTMKPAEAIKSLVDQCAELPKEYATEHAMFDAWIEWCNQHMRDTLIVLDDVPDEVMKTLLPHGGQDVQYAISSFDLMNDYPLIEQLVEPSKIAIEHVQGLTVDDIHEKLEKISKLWTDSDWSLLPTNRRDNQEPSPDIFQAFKKLIEICSGFPGPIVQLISALQAPLPDKTVFRAPQYWPEFRSTCIRILKGLTDSEKYYICFLVDCLSDKRSVWFDISWAMDQFENPGMDNVQFNLSRLVNRGVIQRREEEDGTVIYRALEIIVQTCKTLPDGAATLYKLAKSEQ